MNIIFNKLSCSIFMGINPEEYLKKQTVLINVDITLNTNVTNVVEQKTQRNDFFNYDDAHKVIQLIVHRQHWELQEELIFELFKHLFKLSEDIQSIKIHTEKVDAYSDCFSIGICETMQRDDLK